MGITLRLFYKSREPKDALRTCKLYRIPTNNSHLATSLFTTIHSSIKGTLALVFPLHALNFVESRTYREKR